MPPLKTTSICAQCLGRRFLSTVSSSSPQHANPSIPPLQTWAHLRSRGLLSIRGPDAAHFLQGLTTANIPLQHSSTSPAVIYSAFLNAQGRILHDVFIYPISRHLHLLPPSDASSPSPSLDPAFLIECDALEISRLSAWLTRYKLRSKINLTPLDPDALRVYSVWNNAGPAQLPISLIPSTTTTTTTALIAPDTRLPGPGGFGSRVLLPPSLAPPTFEPATEVPETEYRIRRYRAGVPEGQSELLHATALVQESCVDLMGGVDFRKGCYVGQELVIRTQHTGVVRKRIVPAVVVGKGAAEGRCRSEEDTRSTPEENAEAAVDWPGTTVKAGTEIRKVQRGQESKGRPVGKWVAGVADVGLVLARLEPMGLETVEGEKVQLGEKERWELVGSGLEVRARVPEWWAVRKERIVGRGGGGSGGGVAR